MKEKLIEFLGKSSVNSHFLRLVVGGYIAYLGGSIILDMLRGSPAEPLMAALAVVLTVCGGAIVAVCAYALLKHLSVEETKKDE